MGGEAKAEGGESRREAVLARLHGEWLEIITAVLLALATVASTWSAYQAARWGSRESEAFSEANAARVHAAEADDLADAELDLDVEMFLGYVNALRAGDRDTVRFYEDYLFREEMRVAVAAWLEEDPLSDSEAPETPFTMPEYENANRREAEMLESKAQALMEEAREAIHKSDFYVMLTVLFAAVLFFAGICTKFKAPWIRIGVLVMGVAIFLATLAVMLSQPVI